MSEIGLEYNGKKKPFQFDNPKTGKLSFAPKSVTWVEKPAAEWLMSVNPGLFSKVGERGAGYEEIADAADIINKKLLADEADAKIDDLEPENTDPEETEAVFHTCEKCGRKYADKQKVWYDKHIATCEG
jgi:hypothetical protein